MALAKVYDTADTLMVPIDADGSGTLSSLLYAAAATVENSYTVDAENKADALRELADAIDNARTAAGLDS